MQGRVHNGDATLSDVIWAINRTIVLVKWRLNLSGPYISQVKSRQWLSRLVAKALRYHFNTTQLEAYCPQFLRPQIARLFAAVERECVQSVVCLQGVFVRECA